VGDVRYRGLHQVTLDLYDAPAQTTDGTTTGVVVRLRAGHEREAIAVAAAIQAQARQRDSQVLISGITMLDDVVNKEIAPWRLTAWVFSLFAVLAFGLSMIGLFSVVSLDVANRRHDLAVRIALGATHAQIVGGVFRAAAWRAAAGIAGGLGVSLIATRVLQNLLFGVAYTDPTTYVLVIAVASAMVLLAAYLPARRSAQIDPLPLLRR
jgi:putative ABC transport system permease protein